MLGLVSYGRLLRKLALRTLSSAESTIWLEDQLEIVTSVKLSKQCQMDKMTVSDIST